MASDSVWVIERMTTGTRMLGLYDTHEQANRAVLNLEIETGDYDFVPREYVPKEDRDGK